MSTPAFRTFVPIAVSMAVAAGLGSLGLPLADATGYVEGIDVSHWQNTIDWAQVSASGKRFTFAKATEGQTYTDPMYAANRAGAEGVGIRFGAYHFARPDTTPNDAVLEADHFVTVAAWRSGEITPVLDLEQSGGLSVSQLTAWVSSWLTEVRARTAKRAIIYTSPSFWSTYMGDTSQFSLHGYKLLWIANWGVPQPTVPGIGGCVDGDRYNRVTMAAILED